MQIEFNWATSCWVCSARGTEEETSWTESHARRCVSTARRLSPVRTTSPSAAATRSHCRVSEHRDNSRRNYVTAQQWVNIAQDRPTGGEWPGPLCIPMAKEIHLRPFCVFVLCVCLQTSRLKSLLTITRIRSYTIQWTPSMCTSRHHNCVS